MPIIDNPILYKKAKALADKVYKKNSAYKSGFLVRSYKKYGGTYSDDNQSKNLKRWFEEQWQDVGGLNYPVYRPTVKVSKKLTPLLASEIDPQNLKKQIKLKQRLRGNKNLPPFQKD